DGPARPAAVAADGDREVVPALRDGNGVEEVLDGGSRGDLVGPGPAAVVVGGDGEGGGGGSGLGHREPECLLAGVGCRPVGGGGLRVAARGGRVADEVPQEAVGAGDGEVVLAVAEVRADVEGVARAAVGAGRGVVGRDGVLPGAAGAVGVGVDRVVRVGG